MLKNIASYFRPKYPATLVYMLQSTEYHGVPYLKWFWRTRNFDNVARRRSLNRTQVAKALYAILVLGFILQMLAGTILVLLGLTDRLAGGLFLGLAVFISYPIVWAHLIVIPNELGRLLIIKPRHKKQQAFTQQVFGQHPATVIAVAGSYGKTTTKEILKTVLSVGLKVAATDANKNVATEHAKLARGLSGDEDVVIVEYGEEKPGDIADFATATKPNIGIITGLAPAHLDKYKTLEAAAKDILTLENFVSDKLYINEDSHLLANYIKNDHLKFGKKGVDGWSISNIKANLDGTSFQMQKDETTLKLHSRLVGEHLVGVIALAVAIAHQLGLNPEQITKGVATTKPFEHRMQPYQLLGAWVIDDTYNGNIEGMRNGLELLSGLQAKRKVYVTPGLVDQGSEGPRVHKQLGGYIAQSNPDIVVLMKNSATADIESGLKAGNFAGQVIIQDEPVEFYTNLDKFIAAGDVVLMQNDWTDNYN